MLSWIEWIYLWEKNTNVQKIHTNDLIKRVCQLADELEKDRVTVKEWENNLMDTLSRIDKFLIDEKEDIIGAIQKRGKRIADDPFDINKAYFELDGTVYKAGIGKAVTNFGNVKDFMKKVKKGKIRAKLK